VARKGPTKARMISLSSFLITLWNLSQLSRMTNVKLSKEELALVTDADLILTKNRIIQKVYDLYGDLSEEYKTMSTSLDEEITSVPAKISKGENYRGLPWVMLDYPRRFSQTDVFAVRSFFWWGRFFSITLQLQGKYQQLYSASLAARLKHTENWWMGCGSDAWQHHFGADNYAAFPGEQDLEQVPFIKLAKKIPLQQWDHSFAFYKSSFEEIVRLLGP
jgi:hypothetical protein